MGLNSDVSLKVCVCFLYVYVYILPEIIAMAFSILWLSWVRAGVRRLSHTTFIYYTKRQTGGEPGADKLERDTDQTYSKATLEPLKTVIHLQIDVSCFHNQSLL